MSYNAGWDIDVVGYDRDTGCIDFPRSAWDPWFDAWILHPDREYWLVEDGAGELIGHAHYHIEVEPEGRRIAEIAATICPARRGSGFGYATFTELVRRVTDSGNAEAARNSFEMTRLGALRIHERLGFVAVAVDDSDPSRHVTVFELPLKK